MSELALKNISQSTFVTYEKLINDSSEEHCYMIKMEKGRHEPGVYEMHFMTLLETVKEFSERNKIFYNFREREGNFQELTD